MTLANPREQEKLVKRRSMLKSPSALRGGFYSISELPNYSEDGDSLPGPSSRPAGTGAGGDGDGVGTRRADRRQFPFNGSSTEPTTARDHDDDDDDGNGDDDDTDFLLDVNPLDVLASNSGDDDVDGNDLDLDGTAALLLDLDDDRSSDGRRGSQGSGADGGGSSGLVGPEVIYGDELATLGGLPEIKCATLAVLVERLTFEKYPGHDWVQAFLLTYRSFTTPTALLIQLRYRYRIVPLPGLKPDEEQEFILKKQVCVRVRVHVCACACACVCVCVCV